MKPETEPDYGRTFKRIALRYLLHHSLLILTRKHPTSRLAVHLDGSLRKKLGYANDSLPTPNPRLVQDYAAAIQHTALWHGTGRLQYEVDGKIIDKLEAIASSNTLTPTRDVYSIVLAGKEMRSISATTVRIIARSYADTHGRGIQETNRYGSSLWWVAYYYSLCYAEILLKYGPRMAKNWSAFKRASTNVNGERTWGKKVHSKAKSVWDTFGFGSDIPGNYPVLFGIKETAKLAKLPRSMQKWEARIVQPLSLDDISHIEVPERHIKEVRRLLVRHGHGVPVFPLEVGEYRASQQRLSDLLHPN